MEHAKRKVLVDEKLLNDTWHKPMRQMLQHIKSKQDLSCNRPTDQSAKSILDKHMKRTLDVTKISDDLKSKRYRRALTQFLATKGKLFVETCPSPPPPAAQGPKRKRASFHGVPIDSGNDPSRNPNVCRTGNSGYRWIRFTTNPVNPDRTEELGH
jgi:hypothetical protein